MALFDESLLRGAELRAALHAVPPLLCTASPIKLFDTGALDPAGPHWVDASISLALQRLLTTSTSSTSELALFHLLLYSFLLFASVLTLGDRRLFTPTKAPEHKKKWKVEYPCSPSQAFGTCCGLSAARVRSGPTSSSLTRSRGASGQVTLPVLLCPDNRCRCARWLAPLLPNCLLATDGGSAAPPWQSGSSHLWV